MRQVPHYIIIGSGRMAQHMRCYLDLLSLPYHTWSRQGNTEQELESLVLSQLNQSNSSILLLLKDSVISDFIERHPFLKTKKLIHFSGQLSVPGVFSAHPLMTFIPTLYSLEIYQKIPFILSEDSPDLTELLPGLPNSFYRISEAQRSYYHALCAMSGNFTTLLWQKFFKEMEERFHLPKEVGHPFLQQIMSNLLQDAERALTGPLARGDNTTLTAHEKALEGDAYQKIYQAFVRAYEHSRL